MVLSKRHVLTAALLAAGISGPSLAAESSYEMISYVESKSGALIGAGDYGAAIDAALKRAGSPRLEVRLMETTNLCVAYTAMGRFSEADEACNAALELAKRVDASLSYRTFTVGTETAKAMTNRGVLKAVAGDAPGAARDFSEAKAFDRTSAAPERNLAHLEGSAGRRLAMTGARP